MTHKKPSIDIIEVAHKHLQRHPKDKSQRYLAAMRRSFSPEEVTKALKDTILVYAMVFPELAEMLYRHENNMFEWHDQKGRCLDLYMIAEPFYQEVRIVPAKSINWLDTNKAPKSVTGKKA